MLITLGSQIRQATLPTTIGFWQPAPVITPAPATQAPGELAVGVLGIACLVIAGVMATLIARRSPRGRAPRIGLVGITLLCLVGAGRSMAYILADSPRFGAWDRSMDLLLAVFAALAAGLAVAMITWLVWNPARARLMTAARIASEQAKARLDELSAARDVLERRTAEMTTQSRKLLLAVESAGVVVCRWEVASGAVTWEIGFARLSRETGMAMGRSFAGWPQLVGAPHAERLREICERAVADGNRIVFESPLANDPACFLRLSAGPEPIVAGAPSYMVGMFRITSHDPPPANT